MLVKNCSRCGKKSLPAFFVPALIALYACSGMSVLLNLNAHLHMVPAKIQESFKLLPISQQFRSFKCKIDELLHFLQRLIRRVDDKCVQIQISLKVIS